MKHDYVLRPLEGSAREIRFALHPHAHVQLNDGDPSALTVLRRDENGFITVLLGDRVLNGFLDRTNGGVTLTVDGRAETFSLNPAALDAMRQGLLQSKKHSGPIDVKSPIPGLLKAILVETHATVAAGQTLAVLEAMKMENEIRAPHAGIVEKICASAGQNVAAGALLFSIKT